MPKAHHRYPTPHCAQSKAAASLSSRQNRQVTLRKKLPRRSRRDRKVKHENQRERPLRDSRKTRRGQHRTEAFCKLSTKAMAKKMLPLVKKTQGGRTPPTLISFLQDRGAM